MVPKLARRAIEALVALFALLGFCYVPLGEKTGAQHLGAILRTEAAAQAGRGLVDAARGVRRRIFAELEAPSPPRPPASASPLMKVELADAGASEPPDASLPYTLAQGTR